MLLRGYVLAMAVVIPLAAADCLAQMPPRTFRERLARAITDTTVETRSRVVLAAYSSGIWHVDGDYRDEAGRLYQLGGYASMVMDPDSPISVSAPGMVVAFRLRPRSGGRELWLGGRLICSAVVSPYPGESVNRRCHFSEGAPSLLNLKLEFPASTMDAAETAVVNIFARDDTPTARASEPRPRGQFSLVPAWP